MTAEAESTRVDTTHMAMAHMGRTKIADGNSLGLFPLISEFGCSRSLVVCLRVVAVTCMYSGPSRQGDAVIACKRGH